MPVSYRFDSQIVVIELVGEYSMEEFRSMVVKAFDDPACPHDATLLIDLSRSKSIYARSSTSINAMAAYIASYGKQFNNRLALVVADDLTYGLMRMSASPAEMYDVTAEIFRGYEKAREWSLARG